MLGISDMDFGILDIAWFWSDNVFGIEGCSEKAWCSGVPGTEVPSERRMTSGVAEASGWTE